MPEMVWTEVTRFSETAADEGPRTRSRALVVKEARPAMGRYS